MFGGNGYILQLSLILCSTLYSNIKFILDRKCLQITVIIKKKVIFYSMCTSTFGWPPPPFLQLSAFGLPPTPFSCRHPSWMAPKVNVIVIYAQTHSWSLKEPPIYEYFYNKFHRVISKHPKNKNLLLILSDFNAKTSSFQKVSYPYIIRQYDKGHLSLIGEYLV